MSEHGSRLSGRVYEALLLVYPREFRREYGRQLAQVFEDLCREELRKRWTIGLVGLWARTLLDLIATALVERGKTNGRVLLEFGGRVANLKGLIVANATLAMVATFWSLPGPGYALGGLLSDQQGSLGPLALAVVLSTHFVYPLAGIWAVIWIINYPDRTLGRAAIGTLFAFNAVAGLLLLVVQIRGLVDVLSRRRWVMENFGFDLLTESMGVMVIGAVATAVYLLFALGYGCFLRGRPAPDAAVPVEEHIGGRS